MHNRWSSDALLRSTVGFVFALSCAAASAQTIPQPRSSAVLPPLVLDAPNAFIAAGNAAVKQQLLNKIQSKGKVRLIVKLRAVAEPEHQLDATQLQTQRNGIASVQDNFIQRLAQFGTVAHKRLTTLPFIVIDANEPALTHILASSDVVSVQEDTIMQVNLAQSVPLIGGDKAWAAGATGTGQVVAIVDTGVDSSHPFLTGKVVAEACFSTNSDGAKSVCPNGAASQTGTGAGKNCSPSISACNHGTHVAGIAAGKGSTFSGVAKDAKLIAVQVFTSFEDISGSYNALGAYSSDIMKGLEHVYSLRNTYKIAAVNMSLGGGDYTSNCDTDSLKPIIDNLRAAGIATVIAAGNSGLSDSLSAPGCISTAISVGATTKSDVVDSYSNSASFLSLLAPGSDIKSSVPGNAYANYSGTSMAAPHVAGAWAVLKSKMPNASVTDVLNALASTGKNIKDSRNSIVKPRIQVDAALTKLAGTCYKSSNSIHVLSGRAYTSLGYAYAYGSKQNMGLNSSFITTKLRSTGLNYYVIDSTCP
jgi:subtilisin